MFIRRLEHYNILSTKFEETVKFYTDLLGMKAEPNPAVREGVFIHDGAGIASVHVVKINADNAAELLSTVYKYRNPAETDATTGFSTLKSSGAIDHIAFECGDFDVLIKRLKEANVKTTIQYIERIKLRQVFIRDPNGITLELNFHNMPPL